MRDVMEMFLLIQETITTNVIEDVKEKQNAATEDVEKMKFLQIVETILEDAVVAGAVLADAIVAITFSNKIQSIIYKNVVE
jgi:hypothetical protein